MGKQAFKEGQKVQWTSQAGGSEVTKTGVILGACQNNGISLTQKSMIKILRAADPEITVAEARERAKYRSHFSLLRDVYRVKFDYGWREGEHYLVAVDQGEGRKPKLYHPRTEVLKAV